MSIVTKENAKLLEKGLNTVLKVRRELRASRNETRAEKREERAEVSHQKRYFGRIIEK